MEHGAHLTYLNCLHCSWASSGVGTRRAAPQKDKSLPKSCPVAVGSVIFQEEHPRSPPFSTLLKERCRCPEQALRALFKPQMLPGSVLSSSQILETFCWCCLS